MPSLRDPLTIRSVALPNRLWFPPVARDLAEPDGTVTSDNVKAYRELAAGGVGTVVVEHCFVHPEGRYSARQLGVDRDTCVPGLTALAEAIRAGGAVPILQASFAGARTQCGRRLGPSAVVMPGQDQPAEALTDEQLRGIPALFEAAVRRAREAGFSGVELHGAHGFLLSAFLSPLVNHRSDRWGGSLQGRARLALEVVRAVRHHASAGFLIALRLGADDAMPGGLTAEEGATVAKWLEQEGVDILSVSGGLCGSRPSGASGQQGFFFPQAELVKRAVTIPVVGVGGVTDPEVARSAVQQGRLDLVAVGRRLMAEPSWARKALG
jgi:2,4-dienoyl-CoA reductase-like NADH-dependent reductase (Old Yellow Enzyme family)